MQILVPQGNKVRFDNIQITINEEELLPTLINNIPPFPHSETSDDKGDEDDTPLIGFAAILTLFSTSALYLVYTKKKQLR